MLLIYQAVHTNLFWRVETWLTLSWKTDWDCLSFKLKHSEGSGGNKIEEAAIQTDNCNQLTNPNSIHVPWECETVLAFHFNLSRWDMWTSGTSGLREWMQIGEMEKYSTLSYTTFLSLNVHENKIISSFSYFPFLLWFLYSTVVRNNINGRFYFKSLNHKWWFWIHIVLFFAHINYFYGTTHNWSYQGPSLPCGLPKISTLKDIVKFGFPTKV